MSYGADTHGARATFATVGDAIAACEDARRRGVELAAYFCPRCKMHHVEPWATSQGVERVVDVVRVVPAYVKEIDVSITFAAEAKAEVSHARAPVESPAVDVATSASAATTQADDRGIGSSAVPPRGRSDVPGQSFDDLEVDDFDGLELDE